jgi:uncharacterized lipoprotein YehR (DUF1307 family)
MKIRESLAAALFASVMILALPGCDNDGPVEEAGESIDDAVDETGDAIDDAADDATND